KSINTSIKNKPFEFKKNAYQKSKFLITKSIVERVNIGINTAIDRAVRDLNIFNEWNSESIKCRQEMLAQLAKKVWDVV
ncbi:MAG: GmrSD restriction endonuclease domain-containing protein, partial [Nostoc sp.]